MHQKRTGEYLSYELQDEVLNCKTLYEFVRDYLNGDFFEDGNSGI